MVVFVFLNPFYYIWVMEIDIHEIAEGAILLDGLENAIIGITQEFGNGPRVLYSKEGIIDILMERDGMEYDEAIEFYDFNILGLYVGEQNPIFLDINLKQQ
jgi:hypothetical protein